MKDNPRIRELILLRRYEFWHFSLSNTDDDYCEAAAWMLKKGYIEKVGNKKHHPKGSTQYNVTRLGEAYAKLMGWGDPKRAN